MCRDSRWGCASLAMLASGSVLFVCIAVLQEGGHEFIAGVLSYVMLSLPVLGVITAIVGLFRDKRNRKAVAVIYVFTYVVALLGSAPAAYYDFIGVKKGLFLSAAFFPLGIVSLFARMEENNVIVYLVFGYLMYGVLLGVGIKGGNWKVYALFVLLLLLNVAGCHHGLDFKGEISPV